MKIKFLLVTLFFVSALSAQTTFGLRAGVNFQNINGKDAGNNDLQNKMLTGFHGGVNAEIPLGSEFYVQPGFLFSTKGTNGSIASRTKLNYLELPVNFIYKPVLGTGNLLLGFGPYAAYGVGGEFTDDTHWNKFDAGGNLLAGYEFANKFSFQLNAQLGMVNINKDDPVNPNDKTRMRNTGWGLSLGYRF